MRIGEIAAEAAVNVQSLRYYEHVGLLPSPHGHASGYGTYDSQTVQRVRFIKRAQALGVSATACAR
ncbi:MAG: MerR family transcriptional regulator [Gemmatimonadaceae bacterium]